MFKILPWNGNGLSVDTVSVACQLGTATQFAKADCSGAWLTQIAAFG
ncbi:hypothetical protein [Pseudomonas sp. Gutcm_11s]|nr:hypothetical protein [Pseudomonas sp. Gutcm_11s]MDD0843387.1 hypothetical protein [Pseudomonas sp. Gutcm_11s]